MTTGRQVKMPVKIQADAGEATATLKRLKSQFGSLDRAIAGNLRGQLGQITSTLGGYLSIQGLIGGVRMLISYGERVQEIASRWDPNTIAAAAQTNVAQMRQEQALANAASPTAVAIETERQRQAERRDFTPELYAQETLLRLEQFKTLAIRQISNAAEFLRNPNLETALAMPRDAHEAAQQMLQGSGSLLGTDVFLPLAKTIVEAAISPIAGLFRDPSASAAPVTPDRIEMSDSTLGKMSGAETIEQLREIARNTRGKP